MDLIAKKGTWLKAKDAQASTLPNNQKIAIAAGDRLSGVVSPAQGGTSLKFTAAASCSHPLVKANSAWYLYGPDWDIPGLSPLVASSQAPRKGTIITKVKKWLGARTQPDNSTCQSTCVAMVTSDPDIWGIRAELEDIGGSGGAGDPAVMGVILRRSLGSRYSYNGEATLLDLKKALMDGCLCILHGWFSHSGHVMLCKGIRWDSDRWWIKVVDPYAEFNAAEWDYPWESEAYDGEYSALLIYATCIAGNSFEEAREIYQRGAIDSNKKGLWLHTIKPEAT